ncbi:bifunctional tetrahydrofolate synthase/dihydrofolate synthase [Thiobacillus sp.]|uniref:bifunctional tetrahydrofolate synthase/dihydrofolate synthase n=1 Tax=Thiobacillus sp. TaxID=924 RepID=UPI0011DC0ED8|nr:bifunctional tetrahydrofolate synthase/dihydrofolate synthase [Thiobacillus sp.]TXH76350.1 MAG: bifunctional tetrahydrofolate synthase/dihydrofolate synthase [Thiobacillus sp.]
MQRLTSLDAWLARLERLHPSTIDLGLDRVRRVKDALGLVPDFPLIVVGGTNGKGSTCAYLAAILDAAGYKTGLYTSPHLLRYNERVRVAGREASDAELIAAFERVDAARDDVSLTYFEFGTLGAMARFIDAGIDVAVLEVGLGGRLDAVNVFDADVAVVTSVDLDHMDYLGDSREKIGFEKAGIYRTGRPALCVDPVPPVSLLEHARRTGADLRCVDRDFSAQREDDHWTYRSLDTGWTELPLPAMAGACQLRNASGALAALDAIQDRLPVDAAAIRRGLAATHVPGRFQYIAQAPAVILDVAHNPEAARALAATLRGQPVGGRTLAVVGMLADKDAAGVFAALRDEIDAWWTCTPASPRARDARALAAVLRGQAGEAPIHVQPDVVRALTEARSAAREDDRILVFGSFYTVAAVLDHAATQQ